MSTIQQILAAIGVNRDPSYANVSLLLHMDGADLSTTFTDNSPSPKTVTAVSGAKISTGQSRFGGASGLFNGTTDYLTIPTSADFAFGTGDYTVECWTWITALPGAGQGYNIFSNASGLTLPSSFFIADDGRLKVWNNGLVPPSGFGASVSLSTWQHIAWSRASGTLRAFIAGTQQWSVANSDNHASSGIAVIGKNPGASSGFMNGNIDDLRITKGVGRYTGNFIPPGAPFPDS